MWLSYYHHYIWIIYICQKCPWTETYRTPHVRVDISDLKPLTGTMLFFIIEISFKPFICNYAKSSRKSSLYQEIQILNWSNGLKHILHNSFSKNQIEEVI